MMKRVGALTFLVLAGLANLSNIGTIVKLMSNSGETTSAPRSSVAPHLDRFTSQLISNRHDSTDRDCLKARNDSVPLPLHRHLPKPYINLGFPKMGTSSIHHYFQCGGLDSAHFQCGQGFDNKCADCTRESIRAGLPPLARCGNADAYAQLDDGRYFPQIELLEDLVRGHPRATFLLVFRNMSHWYHSIAHWPPRPRGPHKDEQFKMFNITGSPSNEGVSHQQEFDDWYCRHVQRVRRAVARHPSHALVELDIEHAELGKHMEDMFGIDQSCWGHRNVNAHIHPELNHSKVIFSRHTRPK